MVKCDKCDCQMGDYNPNNHSEIRGLITLCEDCTKKYWSEKE